MNYSFEETSEDLGLCPMGPSHSNNAYVGVIRSYLDELHGALYSIDNLRFRLSASPSKMQEIMDALDRYDGGTDDLTTYSQGKRIGGYRWLWQWRYDAHGGKAGEKTSVVVGYGFVKGNGATDEGAGFIEFNPNKVADKGFELLHYLDMLEVRHVLVKYDLAIDYPVKRDKLRMIKDGRKYGCEISDSMTEYLGQRNKPGRVKLYDKAAERGIVGCLSRVELTCDGSWSVEQVMAHLPKVYNYQVDLYRSLKGVTLAFAIALKVFLDRGDSLEPWLRLVDVRTRAKLRKVLSQGFTLQYDEWAVQNQLKQAKRV